MFKVGDKVEWESQAAGSRTRKTGKVVAVVPAGMAPIGTDFGRANQFNRRYGRTESPNFKCKFDGWPRFHESYLIEVIRFVGDTAKPRLYWPRVSQLRKAKD